MQNKPYWKKLKRECAGHYYAESDFTDRVLRIYKIDRNTWAYHYDRGMTKGFFGSLREAKEYFGI